MISISSSSTSVSSSFIKRTFCLVYPALMLTAFAACLTASGHAQLAVSGQGAEAITTYPVQLGQLEQSFEPRRKSDPIATGFTARFPDYGVQLEKTRLVLAREGDSISIGYVGARTDVRVEPQEQHAATHSYFPASDPATWERNLPGFGRINYRGLYPGVDLSFYGRGGRLEYDFLVQTGASPAAIQLAIDGAENTAIDAHGNVVFSQHGKTFTLLKPIAYQPALTGRSHDDVDAQFVLSGTKDAPKLGFRLGAFDRTRPLVIDPVLVYGIYLPEPAGYQYSSSVYPGTSIAAMQADPAGNTYVIGSSSSNYSGSEIIMKFDPTGHLLWTASLGSSGVSLTPTAIAINTNTGEVFIAGSAFPGLPTTAGAFQAASISSQSSGYVAAISPTGTSLDYASYFGGTGTTSVQSAVADANGNLYIAGSTDGTGFPTTANAYLRQSQQQEIGNNLSFVAKINSAGNGASSLVYSTLIDQVENGINPFQVAVNPSGNAYVTATAAPGYRVTNGAYAYAGIAANGTYVTELNPTGTALIYSAYLGPGKPAAITVDGSGAAYITGTVLEDDFPVTAGSYQTKYPGGFVTKLSPDGSSLVYSTYLGGPSSAAGGVNPSSIAITPGCASACPVRIAGTTTTTDLPLIAPLQNRFGTAPIPNGSMGFLVKINAAGSAAFYSTYLGGENSYTTGATAAVDTAGNVYFAATVEGFDAPVTVPAIAYAAGGFLAKISEAGGAALVAVPNQIVFPSTTIVDTTTSMTGAVEVRNVGSTAVALTRPFALSSTQFTETDNCPATLAAGGICSVNLSFTPSTSGNRTGTLKIASASGSSTISLTGSAIDDYNLVSAPASLAFGDVVINTSQASTLTLKNNGDQVLPIVSVSASLPDFKIANHCPAQVASGAQCTLTVTFTPTQVGLRSGSILVQVPGFYYYGGYAYPNEYSLTVNGTGLTAAAGTGTLELSQPTYNFGSVFADQPSSIGYITVTNTGTSPVSINAIGMTVGQGSVAGDFHLSPPPPQQYNQPLYCGQSYNYYTSPPTLQSSFPVSLFPQSSCVVGVLFQPSITGAETATVKISDSATGSPHSVTFTGSGLDSSQVLSLFPSALTFPVQPVGVASAPQSYLVVNGGDSTVTIDRIYTTGDFVVNDVVNGNCSGVKLGPQGTCLISVAFLPTVTGARTGTLVLTDTSTGNPQTFSLAGTGIVATGSLTAAAQTLAFGAQVQGTTSEQQLIFSNTGDSTVKLNQFTASGDFAVSVPSYGGYPSGCSTALQARSICQVNVVFSPTNSNGAESGVLTAHSSAGDVTVQLTGTALAGTQSLAMEPTSARFGPVLIGGSGEINPQITIYAVNTGTQPVTITSPVSFSNSDFSLYYGNCEFTSGAPGPALAPGANCSAIVQFKPSKAAAESGAMTFTTSAGKQTVTLAGTGVSTLPAVTVDPATYSFAPQAVGNNSGIYDYSNEVYIYNTSNAAITIASVAITAGSSDFMVSTNFSGCAGQVISPGQSCGAPLLFQPSAAGYRTGIVTIKDSKNNVYTASLTGYGLAPVDSLTLSPQALAFPDQIAPPGSANGGPQYFSLGLTNTGNRPLTIGTLTATNVSATGDFAFYPYGTCSGVSVIAGQQCAVSLAFTPQSLGKKTGSVTIPITYADNTTVTLTGQLSGTGVSARRAATITPSGLAFPKAVAGQMQVDYGALMSLTITNMGNESLTVGIASGINLAGAAGIGGDFYLPYSGSCDYDNLPPGATCTLDIAFLPRTAGSLTGSVSFPITYADGTKATLKASLSGTGLAPVVALQLSATQLTFGAELAGSPGLSDAESVTLMNTGNTPATFKSVALSPNFTLTSNGCSYYAPPSCILAVAFTPAATATPGTTTGTLTIVDNTPAGSHTVKLVGQTVASNQPLALSQTALNFGSQSAGTAGSPQVVYLINRSWTTALVNKLAVTGADPGDFTMTQTCGGTLGFSVQPRYSCTLSVAFTPAKTSTGTRTAVVAITPATGPALQIQLTGNATAAATTHDACRIGPPQIRESGAAKIPDCRP